MAKPQEIKKAKRGSISDKAKFVIKNTAKDVAKDVMTFGVGGGAGLGKAAVKAGAKVATKVASKVAKKTAPKVAKKLAEPKSAVKVVKKTSAVSRKVVNMDAAMRAELAKSGDYAKYAGKAVDVKKGKIIKIKGK
jgi:hypothetical protein